MLLVAWGFLLWDMLVFGILNSERTNKKLHRFHLGLLLLNPVGCLPRCSANLSWIALGLVDIYFLTSSLKYFR